MLKAYGLYDLVNGTRTLPPTASNAEKAEWEKKDAKAQKAIVTTVGQNSL